MLQATSKRLPWSFQDFPVFKGTVKVIIIENAVFVEVFDNFTDN